VVAGCMEGLIDLPKSQEPSRGATAPRAYRTVRYLGTEVDDALELAEQTEV